MRECLFTASTQNSLDTPLIDYPLRLSPKSVSNLISGAKSSKYTQERVSVYKSLCTYVFLGTVHYVVDNWGRNIEPLLKDFDVVKDDEKAVEVTVSQIYDDGLLAEKLDDDDFEYEDMNFNSNNNNIQQIQNYGNNSNINIDNNINQIQNQDTIDQIQIQNVEDQIVNKNNKQIQNCDNKDENIRKQQLINLCSCLEQSCIQFPKQNFQNGSQEEAADYFSCSHRSLEVILKKLFQLEIKEPIFVYISVAADFKPVISNNVLNIIQILQNFENCQNFALQYLSQLFIQKQQINPQQWQILQQQILIFLEEVFIKIVKMDFNQNQSEILFQINLCNGILSRWVVESRKVLGSCQSGKLIIKQGILGSLVQLMIKFGDNIQSDPIWYFVIIVASVGQEIIDYLNQVPKFKQILQSGIFRFGDGEAEVYGLMWDLIFNNQQNNLKKILEQVQRVQVNQLLNKVFQVVQFNQ
eukprot:TRINITY_DN11299_c0_g2_i1.p2 TRINITY_DN11299_c0_g2~~TRINITY_DN11299_c0_g2_i1.p2  ORF type:complete len:538 (-),score=59.75 TRINITY_DN11299_c0_g2_i1:628-2031(-)